MWEHYYAKAKGLLQGNAQDTIWVSPLTEQNCQECACRVASHADVLLDRHGGTRDGPLRTAASRLLVGIFRCSRDARGHKKGKNDERASFLIQPCRSMCLCVLEAFPWSFLLTPKISATPWAATTAENLKKLIGLRQVGVFVVNLWNFSVYQSFFVQITYLWLHLSVDTRQKKHVLIGCQTWRVLPPNIWSLPAVKAKR